MRDAYDQVQRFLDNEFELDDFAESDAVVWIDWREYDEDVVRYFNDMMENQLEIRSIDNGRSYGDDIILQNGQKELQIPYKEEMDRDVTIKYLNDFIQPHHEIRLFIESSGDDTLGFILLECDEWQRLENEFGEKAVRRYFEPINFESNMFHSN